MTAGSILLAIALLTIVAAFVARPFIVPAFPLPKSRQSQRQALLTQKEALLTEIEALEFDFNTGKMPANIYESQRAHYLKVAADTLRQLDELPSESTDTAIEQAIQKLRTNQPTDQPANNQPTTASSFCTQCGNALDANDKFCANCGKGVA